jgi:hypothetical protein
VRISFKNPVETALLTGLAMKTSLLKCSVLNFWVKNGPDGTGAFHATLNRAGSPIAPTGGCTELICAQLEQPEHDTYMPEQLHQG